MKLLKVIMTNGTIETQPVSEEYAYLGGRGLTSIMINAEVPPGCDPLGPENKLIFASGPLSGTSVPCASRMAVTGKSPLTGAVGMALSGGHFPVELKFAGYDALIIEGKSEKPVYVWIKDGAVKFRSAKKLWGMKTLDTQQIIKNDLKDQNVRIACIGPAGENQIKIASIINEWRAIGRKGLGAVMGSKNLKAIAVRGNGRITGQVCHVMDIMPTVLEAAGVEYPGTYEGRRIDPPDGKSMMPILRGQMRRGHDALFWKYSHGCAVRQEEWKLVRMDKKPWELYDMRADPIELVDLSNKYPQRVAQLSDLWEKWHATASDKKSKRK